MKRLIYFSLIMFLLVSLECNTYASDTKISGHRVKVIKQIINGKTVVIGCNFKNCGVHKQKKYGKECSAGSDLLQIQVLKKTKKGNKYSSIRKLGYSSLQGGCIEGSYIYIMFSKKPKGKGKNKTAIAKIDLKNYTVVTVKEVYGASNIIFKQLGHANDMTTLGKMFHIPWYETDGKTTYTSKVGYISKKLKKDGKAKKIKSKRKNVKLAVFGVGKKAKKNNKKKTNGLVVGFREETKNPKTKKSSIKRYLDFYTFKKGKYKYKCKILTIKKNNSFPATQCMEYYKKNYYIVRFNKKKGKKDNNCIEKIGSNGKVNDRYIIKDPSSITVQDKLDPSKCYKVKTKKLKWEIECLCHSHNSQFYYTQYRPKKGDKHAFLYYADIK